MSEEGLWKQIQEIVSASDFEADYQSALSSGDINRVRDLWINRADKQLGKTTELLDEAMRHLDKTTKYAGQVTKYAEQVTSLCHALLRFIQQGGLASEFERWVTEDKRLKAQLSEFVRDNKQERGQSL